MTLHSFYVAFASWMQLLPEDLRIYIEEVDLYVIVFMPCRWVNIINKFYSRAITLFWNNPLWLVQANHLTCSSQSKSFISVYNNCSNLKFLYEIGSRVRDISWAVVVAQLVERSLSVREVRCSNPVIGKNLYIFQLYWKDENKKEAGNGPKKEI